MSKVYIKHLEQKKGSLLIQERKDYNQALTWFHAIFTTPISLRILTSTCILLRAELKSPASLATPTTPNILLATK